MNRAQGWTLGIFISFLMWAAIVCIIFALIGCEQQQIERIDKVIADANDIVETGKIILQSPAGGQLPADLRLYGAAGIAIVSIALNSWQKVRSNLMTKTTKAIVKGIEAVDKEKQSNPANPVKAAIVEEMKSAGIYDKGNQIVDRLKVSR